jgi:DNA repair protein RadC
LKIIIKNRNDTRIKLKQGGLATITDAELLSLFFRNDNQCPITKAQHLLNQVDHNLHKLARMSLADIELAGESEGSALYVGAALELGRRRNFQEAMENDQIKGSKDAANFIRPKIGDLLYEEFWVIYLNRRNAVISNEKLSMGGITGTVYDVRLILRKALEICDSSMIACHNHPSGNLEPSDADKRITRQLKDAAAIMDMPVIDHNIVSQSDYFSFADEGII